MGLIDTMVRCTKVDVEERLERLEKMLIEVLTRLRRLEDIVSKLGGSEVIETAVRLVIAFSMPAVKALEASQRIVSLASMITETDPITRSIIEAMSDCSELSISEIERRVRRLRGLASRRIVRERLLKLVGKGLVEKIGSKRPRYRLRTCR